MFNKSQALAIYMEDSLHEDTGKMGFGVMRYSEHPIACVVDSKSVGQTVREACGQPYDVPVVESVQAAQALGAEILVLGTAPPGGKLPEAWVTAIEESLGMGMSLINGLHDQLGLRFSHLIKDDSGQKIWDVRMPQGDVAIGRARAAALENKRVLMVGTDMAIGKMTAGLEIYKWLLEKDVSTSFVATGQIGITVTGKGIPLDAIKVDQAAGAVESAVLAEKESEVIIIEGQGSLLHPGSTATLPLMRGSCPTHLILCHKAGRTSLGRLDHVKIPPLKEFIKLNEDVSSVCGSLSPAKTIGVALNTFGLSDEEAAEALRAMEVELGLPVVDVVRQGAQRLGKLIITR